MGESHSNDVRLGQRRSSRQEYLFRGKDKCQLTITERLNRQTSADERERAIEKRTEVTAYGHIRDVGEVAFPVYSRS